MYPLHTDAPVKCEKHQAAVQDSTSITDHFRGIYRIDFKLIFIFDPKKNTNKQKNGNTSTCNRLDLLETLGSRPIMPTNIPGHCLPAYMASPLQHPQAVTHYKCEWQTSYSCGKFWWITTTFCMCLGRKEWVLVRHMLIRSESTTRGYRTHFPFGTGGH